MIPLSLTLRVEEKVCLSVSIQLMYINFYFKNCKNQELNYKIDSQVNTIIQVLFLKHFV